MSANSGRRWFDKNVWNRSVTGLAILLALVVFVGCSPAASTKTADPGQQFSLAIGKTASVAGEDLEIKFVDVSSDSRCPTGATCIWQGEVTCIIDLKNGQSVNRMTLTQPGLTGEASQAEFNDYSISYNVLPYPEEGKSIKKSDYRLELTVNRKFALSGGILVTFDVLGEIYSIFISNKSTIDEVFAVEQGKSQATIPSGRLVEGPVFYNEPWSWHIDSEDIQMAEVTIELCDGTPSQVEENLDYWVQTVQRFCPWSAKIKKIEDFR